MRVSANMRAEKLPGHRIHASTRRNALPLPALSLCPISPLPLCFAPRVFSLFPLQVYDESGQKLLHSYKHVKSGGGILNLKEQHLRGIACDGKETLYIGQGNGDLLVFQLTKAKLTLVKSVSDAHEEASANGGGISALVYATKESVLVSGDDYGNIVFWSGVGADVAHQKTTRIGGAGSPVNLLAYGHGHVIGAFASGHLRLYDPTSRQLTVEIGAHTRAINGLDVHATRPLVLAAGEDTFASVWQLPTAAAPNVAHLSAESPVLGLLTGARFGGANQELILTTSYDNRAIAIMHTP